MSKSKRWSARKCVEHARSPILPYLRHKGSGLAYTRLPIKSPKGPISKPIQYLGPWGSAESHEFLAHWQNWFTNIFDGSDVDLKEVKKAFYASKEGKDRITVAAAAEQYVEWATNEDLPDLPHIRGMIRCLVHLYENVPAKAFGPTELENVRREVMIREGLWKGKRIWSLNYVNLQVRRLRKMYSWFYERGIVTHEVPTKLGFVKKLTPKRNLGARVTGKIPPVPDDTVEKTLPLMPPTVRDMVRLQRLTGMRPGELCAMRPKDVDRSGDEWVYRPEHHKTEHHGKERNVAIGPQAQAILRPYLLRDSEAFCFSPKESESKRRGKRGRGKDGARPLGDRYSVNTYRQAIQQACDRAGVPHWAPNQLRKAAARAIDEKLGPLAAQAALGHAKLGMTEDTYIQRDKLALAKQVARDVG